MNPIIMLGTILALAWLSTRSRVPDASPVPIRIRHTRQRRR